MTAGRKIVLIGPMGAGKTSLGRRLATRLRWEFTDTDHALCARTGVDIPTIFAAEGEAGFRKREHDVLADILAEPRDMVVACGGGIVTRKENWPLIHQNGTIVLLRRPLDRLPLDGRPISQERGLERLASERGPLYESWADLAIDCTGNAMSDAHLVRSLLGL